MIVEDEYGNDIDLDDEGDPEPPDDEGWQGPADLDRVMERVSRLLALGLHPLTPITQEALAEAEDVAALRALIGDDLPSMLAELRAARAELERWRALRSTQTRYMATQDGQPPAALNSATPLTVEQAEALAAEREHGRGPTPWAQTTYVSPWREYERPPF